MEGKAVQFHQLLLDYGYVFMINHDLSIEENLPSLCYILGCDSRFDRTIESKEPFVNWLHNLVEKESNGELLTRLYCATKVRVPIMRNVILLLVLKTTPTKKFNPIILDKPPESLWPHGKLDHLHELL